MTGLDAVLGERIARHGLADRPATTVAEAAAIGCGLQAQDPLAWRLGVRARAIGLSDAAARHALEIERSVVRTSLMRATIHVVPAADARWLAALFGPGIARSFGKRWRDLGLSPQLLERSATALAEILSDRPMTRPEVTAALAGHGIDVDRPGAVAAGPTHVLLHATTLGLACRGPDRGREPTFVRLDRWLPNAAGGPRGDGALAEIARRYFRSFGPATARDFTVWSGLPATRAVGLIRDELTPVDLDGRAGYRLGEVAPRPGVRLLPAFDNYLLGYANRDAIVPADRRSEVYVGGMIRPTVLVDGRVAGRWRLARKAGAVAVEVLPFDPLPPPAAAAVARETAEIEQFCST